MSIEYVADVEWEEQPDFSLSVDDFGADTLVRTYSGSAETLAAFLATIPRNSPDELYPQLKRTGVQVTGDRSFPTAAVTFRGIFNDDLPDVKRSGGWRRQTVTLFMQSADGGQDERADSATQCTVVYYAPTASYRYVTRIKPEMQRFPGRIEQTKANWEIRQVRGAGVTQLFEARPPLWQAGIVTGGIIRPGYFNYIRTVGTSIFKFDQIGDYWEVTEENEGLIEMVERADLPRLLSSQDVMDAQDA